MKKRKSDNTHTDPPLNEVNASTHETHERTSIRSLSVSLSHTSTHEHTHSHPLYARCPCTSTFLFLFSVWSSFLFGVCDVPVAVLWMRTFAMLRSHDDLPSARNASIGELSPAAWALRCVVLIAQHTAHTHTLALSCKLGIEVSFCLACARACVCMRADLRECVLPLPWCVYVWCVAFRNTENRR